MNAPVKKFISHTVKLTFVSYVCPLTKGSCARVNIHFGPLLQLLFHILPRRFGLKPQRVSHEVDAFFGAVDQRKISYKNRRTNVNCFPIIKWPSCSRRWYLCCIFYSHGGISAILGTRNFSLRCLSSSCLSRYAATSAEVGLQPSEAETRLKVSAGFEPSNGSIAARLGGCRPAERTRHATFF